MGLLDSLATSRAGLGAASTGLRATSQNIANASTPGFTRRELDQSTKPPIRRAGVWLGTGVRVDRIARAADALLFGRVISTTANASAARVGHSALAGLESLFESSSGTSLRSSIDGVFDAFGRATADPSDSGSRREVVAALGSFTRTLNTIGTGLQTGIAERDDAIEGHVGQVNADLAEVGALNKELMVGGGPLSMGDVADRRDSALQRLADTAGADFHYEADGSATVLLAGHAAVSGTNVRTLAVVRDPVLPPRITLSVDSGGVNLAAGLGGAIGGERDARAALASWLADADALGAGLATALNAQHAVGFTETGAAGGSLFQLPVSGSTAAGLRVDPTVEADAGLLAFAGSPLALPGDGDNLRAMLALESGPLVGGKTAGSFASAMVSRVGSETSLASVQADVAEALSADAQALYSNLTSVDLDEEAVNLIQFQTAYQAAAKVIQATNEMLGALLQIVR